MNTYIIYMWLYQTKTSIINPPFTKCLKHIVHIQQQWTSSNRSNVKVFR